MTELQKSETAIESPPPASPGRFTRTMQALVGFCADAPWRVLLTAAILAVVSGYYAATHFSINTNTNNFLSPKLPWLQRLAELDKAFPQENDQILVVIDAATPELAESASAGLFEKLEPRHDLFEFINRPDGGPYIQRNAFLFLPAPEVARTTEGLIRAQPFLATLAADPSLRGVIDAFSFVNRGVRAKAGTYDDFDRPIMALSDALTAVLSGQRTFFSWRQLFTGEKPDPRELRRFIVTKPVLDSAALQPGRVPSDFIRQSARDLGLTPENGVTVRLTGLVPLADEEFSTVQQGFGLNGTITALVVLLIIWLALKSVKIVFAVALTVAVGLAITAAAGLWMVGALNLISVAFAVLFVGIGADFGIQFSVRYRMSSGGVLVVALALFFPTYYGNDAANVMPLSEVSTITSFYETAKPGPVFVADASAPLYTTDRYPQFPSFSVFDPGGVVSTESASQTFVSAVSAVATSYTGGKGPSYLVIAPSMLAYNREYLLTPQENFAVLNTEFSTSPQWKLIVRRKGTVIYELPAARATRRRHSSTSATSPTVIPHNVLGP